MKKLSLFVVILLFIFSCGKGEDDATNTQEDEVSFENFALEQENGGFTAESVKYVDSFFKTSEEKQFLKEDEDFTADDDAEAQFFGRGTSDVYFLRVKWGQFKLNPDIDTWTEWKGFIFAKNAKIFVKKVIRYEDHDFFKPCVNHECIKVNSKTKPHFDGLLLMIAKIDSEKPAYLNIEFQGLYGRLLTLEEIDGIDEVSIVDDIGNRVSLLGMKKHQCPEGFLKGYWKRLNAKGGIFGGAFVNEAGNISGKLVGIWGKRKNGNRVLFGLYVDKDSKFKGILIGRYTPVLNEDSENSAKKGGFWFGIWIDKSKKIGGIIGGKYALAEVGKYGVFGGKWRAKCGAKLEPLCKKVKQFDENCKSDGDTVCEPEDKPFCKCTQSGFCTCSFCYNKKGDGEPASCMEEGTCDNEGKFADKCECTNETETSVDCTCDAEE